MVVSNAERHLCEDAAMLPNRHLAATRTEDDTNYPDYPDEKSRNELEDFLPL